MTPLDKALYPTRANNLRLLADKHGKSNLARMLDRHASQITQWLTPDKEKGQRNMSRELCEVFESALELPIDWFDQVRANLEDPGNFDTAAFEALDRPLQRAAVAFVRVLSMPVRLNDDFEARLMNAIRDHDAASATEVLESARTAAAKEAA